MKIDVQAQKILFLTRSLEAGGAERIFKTYLNNFQAIEPMVLLHRKVIAPQNQLNSDIYCSQVLPQNHPWRKMGRMGNGSKRSSDQERRLSTTLSRLPIFERLFEALQIRKFLKRNKIGLLCSFMFKSNRLAVLIKMILSPRIRVVLNVHEYMSQHLIHAHPLRLERVAHRWLSRLIFSRADLIITVAQGVKADLVTNFGAPAKNIVVIPNPVDIAEIRRKAVEPVMDARLKDLKVPLIVAVGRLVKLKGFDLLIEGFDRLRAEVPAQLVIIGDGEQRSVLADQIAGLGLSHSVHLMGEKANPWKYMNLADIVVLSSLTEAFPNVIGEAFALRKPVMATDCSPGISEYLQRGKCGLLIPVGDAEAIRAGLKKMLTDRDLCQAMASAGADRIAPFAVSLSVKRYENVLLQVAK